MTDPPQISARLWYSIDGQLTGAFKSAQRVNSRRTGQLGPAEIKASYRLEVIGRKLLSVMTPTLQL